MVNIKKSLDEGLENLEKGFAQQVKSNVKAVAGQMGSGNSTQQQQASDSGTNEAGQHAAQSTPQSDQLTKEEVAAFYAPSNPNEQHGLSPNGAAGGKLLDADGKEVSKVIQEKMEEGMTPEDAMKYESLRNKLHQETYYAPLTQRKPHEEEQKEEEKEEEKEKMEDLQLEDQKKKQDDDIALRQSQQKTEKFPGASG